MNKPELEANNPKAETGVGSTRLLACPFCGGRPNIVKHSHRVTVMCCCLSNGAPIAEVHAMTEDAAVEGWNLRQDRAAIEALLLAASKLRIRCNHLSPHLVQFSEWEELTEAMRKAERVLRQANIRISDNANTYLFLYGSQPAAGACVAQNGQHAGRQGAETTGARADCC